jgi:hypothetical protein
MITAHLQTESNAFSTRVLTKLKGLNGNIPEWDRISRRFTPSGIKKVRQAARYIEGKEDRPQSKYYHTPSTRKGWAIFITLTFRERNINHGKAKKALNSWLTMQRKKTPFLYVWTAERQSDGTIHFHIVANRPVPKNSLLSWNKNHGRIDAQYIKRSAVSYISKYITKVNTNNLESQDLARCHDFKFVEIDLKNDAHIKAYYKNLQLFEQPQETCFDYIHGKRYGISTAVSKLYKFNNTANYQFPPEFFTELKKWFEPYDPDFIEGTTIVKEAEPELITQILDDFVECFQAYKI